MTHFASPHLAALAAALALLAGLLWWRRPRPDRRSLAEKLGSLDGRPGDADIDRALAWLPPEQDLVDRRRALRRTGPPTPIWVSVGYGPEPLAGAEEGLVLDRSTGGLCFAAHRPLVVGIDVVLRAGDAPVGSPWVAATVRYCRRCGDCYLVGCAFRGAPPWDVLLLFG